MITIQTSSLTKRYGKQRGIDDLSIEVREGETFGFLGPNGAGKSTTINVLMGFRNPTSGSAKVLGHDVVSEREAIHREVGFVPGELALYENLTGGELLEYFGNLRGGLDEKYARELAERFSCELDRPIGTLSKGNKQKVGLLQALVHRPKLLILDEPTSGLDPLNQREFYSVIKEAKKTGTTVFLSSHVMSEVEHVCDRVAIIRNGKLVSVEKLAKLHEQALRHVEIEFVKKAPAGIFKTIDSVTDVKRDGHHLHCNVRGSMDQVIKELAGYEVKNIISEHASLEELFYTLYGDDDATT